MAKNVVRRCAVCGDRSRTNVRIVWRRFSDNALFDVCLLCCETGRVNETTVNNFRAYKSRREELDQMRAEYIAEHAGE